MNKRELASSEQIGRLCRNCGLCCDGTLFFHVRINGEEGRTRAAVLGFSFVGEEGKLALSLPCAHFSGVCTIYGQRRPQTCGDFYCYPIRRFKRGELELAQMQSLLEQAVTQQRRFVQACGDYPELVGMPVYKIRQRLELGGIQPEEQIPLRRRYAPLLLLGAKLFPLLDEMSFKRRRDKT